MEYNKLAGKATGYGLSTLFVSILIFFFLQLDGIIYTFTNIFVIKLLGIKLWIAPIIFSVILAILIYSFYLVSIEPKEDTKDEITYSDVIKKYLKGGFYISISLILITILISQLFGFYIAVHSGDFIVIDKEYDYDDIGEGDLIATQNIGVWRGDNYRYEHTRVVNKTDSKLLTKNSIIYEDFDCPLCVDENYDDVYKTKYDYVGKVLFKLR